MKRKFYSVLMLLILCLSLTVTAFAAPETLVYDEADLLTDAEESALQADLLEVSETYSAQIVIVTVPTLDGADASDAAETIYDAMEFGYGDRHDGVLLFVSMDPREYRILSNGFAADAITNDQIDAIGDAIVSDLSDGNYADSFETFAGECAYYLDGHLNGFPFNFKKSLILAVVVGLIAGLVTAMILKSQLKSVYQAAKANEYIKSGSMQLTTRNEFFLYRDVTYREKPKDDESSKSGSSRNVGGGSF